MTKQLPDPERMYQALLDKDASFEGIFFVGVKSTGIFCRPTCTARKPKKKNVEFFPDTHEALCRGFRPCKICDPMTPSGALPDWLQPLMREVQEHPDQRFKDRDLLDRGLEPNRVRRWFKKHHRMTFQTYLRTLRIGTAFGRIKYGDKVMQTAFNTGYESLSGFTESFKKTTGFSPNRSPEKQLITINRILTPLGPMLAGATEEGICLLEFVDRRMLETQLKRLHKYLRAEFVPGHTSHMDQLNRQLKEYFQGERRSFSIPLVFTGTDFQKSVWQVLLTIPYGSTRTYGEQAKLLGRPKAVRAVGTANGDNKISILVPCHRVIGADGKLTGYGGGLWRKQFLLDLEIGTASQTSG